MATTTAKLLASDHAGWERHDSGNICKLLDDSESDESWNTLVRNSLPKYTSRSLIYKRLVMDWN